ncbi:MAG: glycosyltransferase [Verrucomicrobia bacterium]|jgi:glycosyltransferase involved in cell wall biosynthesis|nr:glycosyltransferase [Verrucomicrobiota bacterium]
MRLLFLATYFPDPFHPSRGNWALEQAQAFQNAGDEVLVMVPTAWVPRWMRLLPGKIRNHALAPPHWQVEDLSIEYPRWPYYPWHFLAGWNRRHPSYLLRMAWLARKGRFLRRIDEFEPDAICAHHTLVNGQLAWMIFQARGIPYFVTDHEIGDLLAAEQRREIADIFRKVGKSAKAMVVVSKAMQRKANTLFPELPVKTIYNGSSFPATPSMDRPPRTEPVIFSCAKFYGRKDIPLLVRAFDRVAETSPGRLRIAGDGPDRAEVESAVAQAGHRDRIELLGLLRPEEVRKEMGQADIFALVGWAEPFGVVFLEAMACGLPVLLSEDAGIAEILEDGKTAVFSKPRDRTSVEKVLRPLLQDAGLRKRIGEAGRMLYREHFQWASIIRQYQDILTREAG